MWLADLPYNRWYILDVEPTAHDMFGDGDLKDIMILYADLVKTSNAEDLFCISS